ncbi:MAG TPA: ABC transporter ATP-binding protein/permease, partial [Rhizomicrobium sp.]
MARPITEEGDGAPSFRPLWTIMPYLWPKGRPDLRARVVVSIFFLLLATGATSYSPLFFGRAVDALAKTPGQVALGVALTMTASYVLSRILMQAFAQLRDGVFAQVQYHAMREVAVSTFAHVHTLSLRFHLERKTGGLSRVIERGTKGIDTLLSFSLFSIFPTILLLVFYTAILLDKLDVWIAIATLMMVVAYVWFTFAITRWRIQFRRDMNQSDQDANTKAVDSLLNYETVKYFNNEGHETRRFDVSMEKFSRASIQAQLSLSILNTGQAFIMAVGLGTVMWLAAVGISQGRFSVGLFATANAILIQLYLPLNLLGTVYREITQAMVDMDSMFKLLHQPQEVTDKPGAKPLVVSGGEIKFDNVVFAYEPARIVLKGISFTVPAGKTVAVVGPSGAGKSTISRILYRFYDIKSGAVTIDGQDIRDVTQSSLREKIGIVPQDTVLFNDTVKYNIAYGRIGATEAEIKDAARYAQIDPFIRELPLGYESMVGERGLKLSGGEKQRVAIARTILKNPPIL